MALSSKKDKILIKGLYVKVTALGS